MVALEVIDTGESGVGVLNGAVGAGAVVGSVLALLVVGKGRLAVWFGVGVALWGLPLAGPLAVIAWWPALRRLDLLIAVRDTDIQLLRLVPMFRSLPQATIEQLAAAIDREEMTAGTPVFEQGETGDRVYIVEHGRADVVRDGRRIATLERGAASVRSHSCATVSGRPPSGRRGRRSCGSPRSRASAPSRR